MTDKIEVTQADRECAEQVYHTYGLPLTYAKETAAALIARHRLAHSTPADQEPVAWREGQTGAALVFDDGILNLNRDGSGSLCFRDEVLEYETDDETGDLYRYADIAAFEVRAIRDELNKWFPPTPVDRNAVLEEAGNKLAEMLAEYTGEDEGATYVAAIENWRAALKPEAPAHAKSSGSCEDCPPEGYPTDETRCLPCPRRNQEPTEQQCREHLIDEGISEQTIEQMIGEGWTHFAIYQAELEVGSIGPIISETPAQEGE